MGFEGVPTEADPQAKYRSAVILMLRSRAESPIHLQYSAETDSAARRRAKLATNVGKARWLVVQALACLRERGGVQVIAWGRGLGGVAHEVERSITFAQSLKDGMMCT